MIMAEFSYKWDLANIVQDKKHIKVFSCFSCGGGSTMGYKRAGFDVIGNVEIDPKINAMYVKNHRPKFNYCMDLRDFNKLQNLPEELFTLDILDGSPPCSTFSMAGLRERAWNKEKYLEKGRSVSGWMIYFLFFGNGGQVETQNCYCRKCNGYNQRQC